jgi:hypothetical protein
MAVDSKTNEQGSARLRFVIVIAIIGVVAFAAYQYVPVAYNAYLFKDLMQQKVDAAVALGHPPEWIKTQLQKSASEYSLPEDALIEPLRQGDKYEVRVQFKQPIEFPGYTYEYTFDHTSKSKDFLVK